MANTRSRFRWLATAAAIASLAACTDANPNGDGLPTDAGAGLYPHMTVSTSKGTANVDLGLRQVPGGLTLASYQGEVVFDPQALSLQSADLPEGVIGDANEVSPGHIRFAGMALDGTEGAQLLRMRFTAKGAVTRETFRVTFEEVTDATEYADVTAQVKNGTLLYQQR
ncbi:MAG TPA: cohesin domain-containing protein [Longimicrobium sp.]